MTKVGKIILFGGMLYFFVSCRLTSTSTNNLETEDTSSEENSSLFLQQTDRTYIFSTNDTKYANTNGYTIWTIQQTISSSVSFSTFTTDLVKSQGNTAYGYGIVFNENTDSNGNKSMISVMIRTTGGYAIGKIENGLYSDIQYWTQNKYIKTGLGSKNSITVSKDTASAEYSVIFNRESDSCVKFSDIGSYQYNNGNRGFVVVLSPDENFPTNSVVVSFKTE
jgi:hypothetical protein